MPDSIFLVGDDGVLAEASGTAYEAEAELQELLARNLDLLAGAQIDRDKPRRWLLVKREAGIPDRAGGGNWWSIDHLVVDQDAIPTFVEVKRASDTRSRREVVAQMLDYAANGSVFWTPDQLRSWFEGNDPDGANARLLAWLEPAGDEPGDPAGEFWQAVGTNLREGRIRLIFVADEIPASLQRLVEFLNEQMPRVEVLAIEIRQYRINGGKSGALVPRLIGQTSRAQAAKQPGAGAGSRPQPWSPDEVREAIARAGHDGTAAEAVLQWAAAHPHVRITGGTGLTYPSVTMYADSGHAGSRPPGVLSLYASPGGEQPMLEIRVKQMCSMPPYDQASRREQLIAQLRGLGIPHLEADPALATRRPNIPLGQLTSGRVQQLLSLVDEWITGIRAHAAGPQAGNVA